jgi:monoamine oxidase
MQATRIGILGGGLSGLYAAFLLEQKGIKDYVLLEARDNLGGRISCVSPSGNTSPRMGVRKTLIALIWGQRDSGQNCSHSWISLCAI